MSRDDQVWGHSVASTPFHSLGVTGLLSIRRHGETCGLYITVVLHHSYFIWHYSGFLPVEVYVMLCLQSFVTV